MSRELIESIVAGDFVCANQLFEEQLEILREQKLYEEKKRIAAKAKPFVQNTKADWAKYRKQNPSVKWNENKQGEKVTEKPKETPLGKGGKLSAADIKTRRKAGYLQAHPAIKSVEFIKAVRKYKETGKLNEVNDTDKGVPGPFQASQLGSGPVIPSSKKSNFAKKEKKVTPGRKPVSDMSPWLRRAELEKKRQAKIAAADSPLKAARLMTRKEIGKAVAKKVGRVVGGALSDIGSQLEE